jgi:hypothetical protein
VPGVREAKLQVVTRLRTALESWPYAGSRSKLQVVTCVVTPREERP